MTVTLPRLSREFLGASTDDLANALAQRMELVGPDHLFAAYAAATARYWRRRAASFEAARPRPGEFRGRDATDATPAARWDRLAAIADACYNRAAYADLYGCTDTERALIVSVAEALVTA